MVVLRICDRSGTDITSAVRYGIIPTVPSMQMNTHESTQLCNFYS